MKFQIQEKRAIGLLPNLPDGQEICDIFPFAVGKRNFFAVTALHRDRNLPALTRLFRLRAGLRMDPEPVYSLSLFHPRNLALAPEKGGRRRLWFADHGPDFPPFPGGAAPMLEISASGRVSAFHDPLLARQVFSFDGCLWENPATGELYLYQANIGRTPPRLLRWDTAREAATDLSFTLPLDLLLRKERFLVSRLLNQDKSGVDLFLGGDYSDPAAKPFSRDMILHVPFRGKAERRKASIPKRLRDATWSTVEASPFPLQISGKGRALLLLYHDKGYRQGLAEVLRLPRPRELRRTSPRLRLPTMEKSTWIARAAIGDLTGDGRNDLVLYRRTTSGAISGSWDNTMIFRQNSRGGFDHCVASGQGQGSYYLGGFFAEGSFLQLRGDGVLESTRFSFCR